MMIKSILKLVTNLTDMERTELETQYRLERDICAGANASDYHKKTIC